MVRITRCVVAAALVIGAILGGAATESTAQEKKKASAEEAEIRRGVQSYVEAFNKGDAAAVASQWSDDAVYVSPEGDRFKGRKEIEAFFKKMFSENKGLKIKVSVSSIRFPSPDKARETGSAVVTRAGETPEESLYVADYVKQKGAWKLAAVREEGSSAAYEHLKELEWLIGEWIDKDESATLETTYRWTKNRSFIAGSFTVYVEGKVDLQGTQVIGWDPASKLIRSWVFDSQGGFGLGIWFKNGNQWIAESSGVLSSGEKATAINVYTQVDDNTFTLQSIGRQIGGVPAPNIDEVVVVRKQTSASTEPTPEEKR